MEVVNTEDHNDAFVETLSNGQKRVYKKSGGRIDNNQFLNDHKKDFLQPFNEDGTKNKEFQKEYGEEIYKS